MKQIKNYMTKEKIAQDLKEIANQKHEESPAHLEYVAQQYFDKKQYEIALD